MYNSHSMYKQIGGRIVCIKHSRSINHWGLPLN